MPRRDWSPKVGIRSAGSGEASLLALFYLSQPISRPMGVERRIYHRSSPAVLQ